MMTDDLSDVLALGSHTGTIGVIWNRFGIKSLQIKTDGLLEIRSRADRAEGRLDEQSDIRDRDEKKEHDAK